MKKVLILTVSFHALAFGSLYAEDIPAGEPSAVETPTAPVEAAYTAEAAVVEAAADIETAAAPVEEALPQITPPAEPPAIEAVDFAADNLEFISGEITAMDEAAKTVTVKMYGETAENETEKTLSVTVDANTDITDGEQDRDLKSLTTGTEVDVEYDPATKKATYIFVY